MDYRPYDSARDKHACWRIYREVGWIRLETEEMVDEFFSNAGKAIVAELNGEAECLVTSSLGDLRYQDEVIPFGCITGVTTSLLGRKQGLAGGLTAAAVAECVADGAAVCGLGMFEQGYYDRLGFGTGSYEVWASLPAADLKVDVTPRVPRRLTLEDFEAVHAARLNRRRAHGSVSLTPSHFTRGRMYHGNAFGFGYADEPDGGLSHLLWCHTDSTSHGPYYVKYLIYRTREQFLELMALLKSFGNQVHIIRMHEPAEVQLQDLVRQPFRLGSMTHGSKHEMNLEAMGWWQMRICDLPACLARTRLCGEPVRFNLQLSDPIADHLPGDQPWRGVAGEYVVTLGPESAAEPGHEAGLPTMQATVNAFTRLWLGVRPATGLATTDKLQAPEELLERLNRLIRLPVPLPDWDM